MVDIAIHRHGPRDPSILLHAADRDCDVVDHAEALAMVGKGMVKSAADVKRDSISQRVLSSEDRSARSQPESPH